MSKTTGTVGAVSDYNDKDYYNIALGDPEDGNWFIGNDSTDLEKGQKVEIEYKNDNQIQKINIIEEDNEDGQQGRGSDDPMGGASSDGSKSSSTSKPQMSERQANIMANSATKMAVEDAETNYSDDKAKHIEEVDERSQAYQNIMKTRLRENL